MTIREALAAHAIGTKESLGGCAEAALWLLADGAPLRRLVIDGLTGQLLDFGTTSYAVPPTLSDLLIARHVTSASPHSNVSSGGCDMEHNLPHLRGGPTNPLNVTPGGLTCIIEPYDYRADP